MKNENFSLSSLGPTSHEESAHLLSSSEARKQNKLAIGRHLSSHFIHFYISSFCSKMWKNCFCCREKELSSRTIWIGRESSTQKFPPNVIRNQKYSLFSFIPMVSIFKLIQYFQRNIANIAHFFSGAVQSIQVLSQSILLDHGNVTIHTTITYRILIHILGTPRLRHFRHHDP